MTDAQFASPAKTRRYEFVFCLASTIFWAGILIWVTPTLWLPWIYGNANNLFGIGLLTVVGVVMVCAGVFFAARLLFEIHGATVTGSQCTLIYRYLGTRLVHLPFGGHVKRNVRVPDLRSDKGYREAILVYRGITERVLIPLDMQGAEDLTSMLSQA